MVNWPNGQPCLTMVNCTVGCEKALGEYIFKLRQARQWKYVKPNIKVVDLVFQVDKIVAPGHWQLAFVKEDHPASSTGIQLF